MAGIAVAMPIFITFLVLLLTITARISSARLVCPPDTQSFISRNRNLLPLDNVKSTSEQRFSPKANFVGGTSSWCTNSSTDFFGQYVELTFTEPVVLALIMSNGPQSSFVNNFTISYTMSTSGEDFQTYGLLQDEQDFYVRDIRTSNANFVLSDQIVGRRFRFVIINGTITDTVFPTVVCWSMLLFGCTMEQAQEVPDRSLTTTSPTTASTSGETASPLPSNCPNLMPEESSNMLLLIVVPAGIGIVIIVAVIVAILVCICCMKSANHHKSHRSVTIEKVGGHRTRDMENGTTTPSSSNFHYDNPRFLCYDVPRSSMGRQNSVAESISTLGSHAEIKNPAYITKKSLQAMDLNTYHMPPEESNDYEDVPGTPPAVTELDKRTVSNTHSNSFSSHTQGMTTSVPPPPILTDPPKIPGKFGTPNNIDASYSKVNKMKSRQKDEMERDYASPPRDTCSPSERNYSSPPRDYSSPPVINAHYISSEDATAVLAQEIDRLANDLENSRAIVRQW